MSILTLSIWLIAICLMLQLLNIINIKLSNKKHLLKIANPLATITFVALIAMIITKYI